ncbi:hypothetical protein LCGC14_1490570 [marine sediment metagenome]|uniref:Uncharacterized protein n=1 Tax=marine sediment metagenome TaxID=412755 RepID=A0A0F9M8K9_9ZZZZ
MSQRNRKASLHSYPYAVGIMVFVVLVLITLAFLHFPVKTIAADDPQCNKYKITVRRVINGSWEVVSAYKASWNSSQVLKVSVCDSDYEFIYIPYHSIIYVEQY